MDDLQFVQKCVNGDTRAWNDFIDRYSRLIYSYIYSVLKLKSAKQSAQTSAEDIFQQIFLLLRENNFKKLRSFKAKNGSSLATWLRQVVINFTIDSLRRIKPAESLDEDDAEGFGLEDILADDADSEREIIISEEKIGPLKDCIEILDTDDKYFLELHFNQSLALEDLKDILKISRAAVDMRKFRLISRLRDCFKSKGFQLDF